MSTLHVKGFICKCFVLYVYAAQEKIHPTSGFKWKYLVYLRSAPFKTFFSLFLSTMFQKIIFKEMLSKGTWLGTDLGLQTNAHKHKHHIWSSWTLTHIWRVVGEKQITQDFKHTPTYTHPYTHPPTHTHLVLYSVHTARDMRLWQHEHRDIAQEWAEGM